MSSIENSDDIVKRTATFSDLPIETLTKVIGELNLFNRLSIRKVSSCLRSIVDHQTSLCHFMGIEFFKSSLVFRINNCKFKYVKSGNKCMIFRLQNRKCIRILTGKPVNIVANDFRSIIIQPKLIFEEFYFDCVRENIIDEHLMFRIIQSFPEFKIHAKRLVLLVRDLDTSLDVVSRFEPRTLHSLYLRSESEYIAQSTKLIEHLSNTDQWKLALYINLIAFQPIRAADLKWFYHLEVFLVNLVSLSGKEIQGLFDVISKNSSFQGCVLKMSNHTIHPNETGELLKYMPPDENVSEDYHQYPTSNPQECIELHFFNKKIYVFRKSRS